MKYVLRLIYTINKKKYRIRETNYLSTDADSSTDTMVVWTKNTPKPIFLITGKNHSKRKNSKMVGKNKNVQI